MEQQVGIYHDSDLIDYLYSIKRDLLAEHPLKTEKIGLYIIDEALPNAFAAPDASIFISRGMLALVNSEDALAAVLAHELVHIERDHHVKQARRSLISNLLSLPGKAVSRVISENIGQLVNSPIENLGDLYLAGYSRSQEEEADIHGIQLMHEAGYDPRAMGEILQQMNETLTLIHRGIPPSSFFDSHPSTPDRVEAILDRAREMRPNPRETAPGEHRNFLQHLDGLAFGVNPSHGIFHENRFIHPDHNLVIDFPQGWSTINTPLAAGALSPRQEGAIYLGNADFGSDPMPYAQRMRQAFHDEFGINPIREEEFDLNGNEASMLVYRDHSSDTPTQILFLWVSQTGRVFQVIAVSDIKHIEAIEAAALSLRPLSESEREKVQVLRIRLAKARKHESLSELSDRTRNRWTLAVTAIANQLPENHRFTGGELVKIVREEPYWSEEPLPGGENPASGGILLRP